jgi:DNA-binding Lrp family transcriptional regulator
VVQRGRCTNRRYYKVCSPTNTGDSMVLAFVLLNTIPGQEEKLAETLRQEKEVKECHVVYGEYDMHLTLDIEDLRVLDDFIYKLRSLEGIEHTMTLVAVGA